MSTRTNEKRDTNVIGKEAIAGFIAGSVTSIIAHPLDLIKLRLQLLSTSSTQTTLKNVYREVFRDILRDETKDRPAVLSLAKFYRGLAINFLGNSIAWGGYFSIYRVAKDKIAQKFRPVAAKERTVSSTLSNSAIYLTAGTVAGILTSILTNPIWVIKTRIMGTNRGQRNKAYDSIVSTVRVIVKNEGYSALFKGLTPSILGVSHGAIYFMIYDSIKQNYLIPRFYQKNKKMDDQFRMTNTQTIMLTSICKMIATTSIYPLGLLKSNLQSDNAVQLKERGRSMGSMVYHIYAKHGLRGLYSGLGANLLKTVPTTCITFLVYENLMYIL